MPKLFKRLANKTLKKNKNRTFLLYVTITLTITLFVTLFSCADIEMENTFQKALKQNGTYQYEAYHITEEEHQLLKETPYVTSINTVYTYGGLADCNIGYVDNTSLLPFEILEGRMPRKENEIALEEVIIERLNLSIKIGESFDLTYRPEKNTEEITETFILTGIIKNESIPKVIQAYVTQRDTEYKTTDFYQTLNGQSILIGENIFRNAAYDLAYSSLSTLKGNFMMVIWAIGAGIIMNVLSGLAQSIEKDLRLLRGIGASKIQVASLVFYQVLKICIIAFPLGFSLGYLLSFIYAKTMGYRFLVQLDSTLNVLMISILTIFIGMAIPTIKAANISLQGNFTHHHRQIKVKENTKLTPFHLARRHMRFKKWQNALLVFIVALILAFITSTENLTTVLGLPQQYAPIGNFADMEFELSNLNENPYNEEISNSLSKIDGIKSFEYLPYFTGFLLMDNQYMQNLDNEYVEDQYRYPNINIFFIPELDEHYYDLFNLGNVDREAFNRGETALIYIPKMIKRTTPNGQYFFLDYHENTLKAGDEIFKDERIKVGETIPFSYGNPKADPMIYEEETLKIFDIKIGGIISGTSEHLFKTTTYGFRTYNLVVSPAYISKLHLENVTKFPSAQLYIHTKEDADYFKIAEDVKEVLNNQTGIFYNSYMMEQPRVVSHPRQMKYFAQYLMAISIIFLLLYQQCITKIALRKKESGMYQTVGMEKDKLIKVFTYEGLILGISSVLLSIVFRSLTTLIEIGNDPYRTFADFSFRYEFPPNIRWICLGIYIIVIAIFFAIYYFPTKNLLKEKMLDRVKYKE